MYPPDSFVPSSRCPDKASAVAKAQQMITEGVDIIDIGGESTRSGAAYISKEEKLSRIL